ncbi:hypothetical protein J8273_8852 [Carpediemonas membranifera]|uniref:Uncharacterized protein n=1 Tax=Carpediemonas membranifera TaxID=201153 RepID=A0A8J6DX83_9EUKA|nr:hypothetical protein J8273_8852 [Carpediemonas membranifera]|eukprot:KAG9389559.1 hypothetical protein J8273_8852 [Carpediemonas membranifera]
MSCPLCGATGHLFSFSNHITSGECQATSKAKTITLRTEHVFSLEDFTRIVDVPLLPLISVLQKLPHLRELNLFYLTLWDKPLDNVSFSERVGSALSSLRGLLSHIHLGRASEPDFTSDLDFEQVLLNNMMADPLGSSDFESSDEDEESGLAEDGSSSSDDYDMFAPEGSDDEAGEEFSTFHGHGTIGHLLRRQLFGPPPSRRPRSGEMVIACLPNLKKLNGVVITRKLRAHCMARAAQFYNIVSTPTEPPFVRSQLTIAPLSQVIAYQRALAESKLTMRPVVQSLTDNNITVPMRMWLGNPRMLEYSPFSPDEMAVGTEGGNLVLFNTHVPKATLVVENGRERPRAWCPAAPLELDRRDSPIFGISYFRLERNANMIVATCGNRFSLFDRRKMSSNPGEYLPLDFVSNPALPENHQLMSAHTSMTDEYILTASNSGVEVHPLGMAGLGPGVTYAADDANVGKWFNTDPNLFVVARTQAKKVDLFDRRADSAISSIDQIYPIIAIPRADDADLLISNMNNVVEIYDIRAGKARSSLLGIPTRRSTKSYSFMRAYYSQSSDILAGCVDDPTVRWFDPDGRLSAEWTLPETQGVQTIRPAPFGQYEMGAIVKGAGGYNLMVAQPATRE